MLEKIIAPLLIGTVMLFTLQPSKTSAQTLADIKLPKSEYALSETQVKPKIDFRAAFAKEQVNVKNRTLTAADYERIETKRQAQISQQAAKKGWSKRQKIFLIAFIIGTTALVTAVLIHGIDDSVPNCLDEPSAPGCN